MREVDNTKFVHPFYFYASIERKNYRVILYNLIPKDNIGIFEYPKLWKYDVN